MLLLQIGNEAWKKIIRLSIALFLVAVFFYLLSFVIEWEITTPPILGEILKPV